MVMIEQSSLYPPPAVRIPVRCHHVREIAQVTAPRSDTEGPHYADQFKVDASAGNLRIGRFRRRIVTVVNEHPNAVRVEFGNVHVPAQHILADAGSKIGEFRGVKPGD